MFVKVFARTQLIDVNLVGFGYHGDFIEAWAPGVLQDAVDQCTNLSGNMEDCPVFSYNSEPGSCALENPLPAEIASEDVKGPMQGLPNGNQVQSGPEPASQPAGSSSGRPGEEVEPPKKSEDSPKHKAPVIHIADFSELSSYQGAKLAAAAADQDIENRPAQAPHLELPKGLSKTTAEGSLSTYTSSLASAPAPAPTSTPDKAPVALEGGKVITTAYWTSGRQAHEVIVVLEEVTITADGGKVTKTEEAGAEATLYKRQHRHHHHASRGIGGRKML